MCQLARALLALSIVAGVACGSVEDGDDGGGSSASGICYFESKSSYSCSDGAGDPGEWTRNCSAITKDACFHSPDFDGWSDVSDGCVFRAEFRGNAWMGEDECRARLGTGGGGGGGTGGSGGGSGSGSGGGSPAMCGNGICEAGEPASCPDCAS